MSSEKKYFFLGIVASIFFGIVANVLTPIFLENRSALIILLLAGAIFLISVFSQDIRTWLAKKSLISKKQRIKELQAELEDFNAIVAEVNNDTKKFVLLVVRNFFIPFLILLFCLFSRISISSIISVLVNAPATNLFDFYASIEAVFLLILIVVFSRRASRGWSFAHRVVYPEKYTLRLQQEINSLMSTIVLRGDVVETKSPDK